MCTVELSTTRSGFKITLLQKCHLTVSSYCYMGPWWSAFAVIAAVLSLLCAHLQWCNTVKKKCVLLPSSGKIQHSLWLPHKKKLNCNVTYNICEPFRCNTKLMLELEALASSIKIYFICGIMLVMISCSNAQSESFPTEVIVSYSRHFNATFIKRKC